MSFGPDSSFVFLGASHLASAVSAVAALTSAWLHFRAPEEGIGLRAAKLASTAASGTFLLGLAASLTAVILRWFEVNHWPVQSMFEALTMTASALYVSFAVLWVSLRLYKTQGVARGLSDLFLAAIMAGEFFLLWYTQGQEKGPRSLPPALQSYWMAPHVSSLLLSYVTLSIAYVAAIMYFTLKMVRTWFGGADKTAKPITPLVAIAFVGFLLLVPYAHLVNLAIAVPVAILGARLNSKGKVRSLDAWLDGFDQFSFQIFAIGFPFLTAGLMMGGFWAQEAWALYWGWDSKETSALISWLIYVVYMHLRVVAGWRGERSLWAILGGAVSILITFQLFGYLPASQESLHTYTDGVSREGMQISAPKDNGRTDADIAAKK